MHDMMLQTMIETCRRNFSMKAVLCKVYGMPETLVVEEIEPLHPGKGQVVVAVKACGVNFPDTLIIQGKYQFKPPMPFVPGGEVAGIVKEVGEEVDTVKVGDRVIGFTSWGGFAGGGGGGDKAVIAITR